MKKLIIASAILIGGLVATAANAMPAVAITKAPTAIIKVDYVCGPGYHQTPWGDCRRNGWRRPPPPPPRYYGHHRPPPPYWDRREWHHHRHYDYY